MAQAPEIIAWIPEVGSWVMGHPYQAMGLLAAGPVLALALRCLLGQAPHAREETYGSACWATAPEMRRAGLFRNHGVVLGRAGQKYLTHDGPEHVMLVGPTRSGKGISTIIPTLLIWRESALILDPKQGENADVTAAWRATLGPVYRFTPMQAPITRLNVLSSVRLKTVQEISDATLIAQSLVAPEKMARENATSLHFRELAGILLAAAILHVLYTRRRKSLAGVWDFLTQAKDLGKVLEDMATASHLPGGTHLGILSRTRAIQNISGDRELSSVWTTAIRPLALYADPTVAQSTDTSDMDLDDLQHGTRPVSLYLIAPSPIALEQLHPVYRVILDVALARLMERKVRTWGHRLLLCADELPAYGYVRAIEKGLPVIAGHGMKAVLVAQDFEQLWDVYGSHTAIWGNTRVKVFHTPDHDLTAKRISENLLGTATVETPVAQQSPVMGWRRSVSLGHHGRPLLTPDEVMGLLDTQEIIRVSGVKPILASKVDYRNDRWLRARAS